MILRHKTNYMLSANPTYAYIVSAPVQLTKSMFFKSVDKADTSPNYFEKHILVLIETLNKMLIDAKVDAIKLTKEEASELLKGMVPERDIISSIDRSLDRIENDDAYILPLKNMWNNFKELIDDIILVASSPEIDETSEDYMKFIVKLSDECSDSDIVYGKENLYSLFA